MTEEKAPASTTKPPEHDAGSAKRLVSWLKQSVEAGERERERVNAAMPRWIRLLTTAVVLMFVGFVFGLFGNRPYIVMFAFWLLFAAVQTRARTLFPQCPNLASFTGWFVLACMAALIGYLFFEVELGSN